MRRDGKDFQVWSRTNKERRGGITVRRLRPGEGSAWVESSGSAPPAEFEASSVGRDRLVTRYGVMQKEKQDLWEWAERVFTLRG